MLLSESDLELVKAAAATVKRMPDSSVDVTIAVPEGRTVRVHVSTSGVYIRTEYPDSAPAQEFYKTAQGMALAYGVPVHRVAPHR